MREKCDFGGMEQRRPYVLLEAGKLTASLIPLVARDMYVGLSAVEELPAWEAFLSDACLYHEVKRGLRKGSMEGHDLKEDIFFRLKKCIFHWDEGIALTFQCAGLSQEQAETRAAENCAVFLRGKAAISGPFYEIAKKQYETLVGARIRKQYERRGETPSDDWCAWLELSAVKIMCLMIREQMKELYHGEK